MLTPPKPNLSPENAMQSNAAPLRICAICDGFEALLRLSAWLVHLPATTIRTDLGMVEALEHLHKVAHDGFDQIIVAPDSSRAAAPKMVVGVLQAAAGRGELVVLLPPGARMKLPPIAGMQIHYGPPFAAPALPPAAAPEGPEAASGAPEAELIAPTQGLFSRLFGRRPVGNRGKDGLKPMPDLPDKACRLIAFQPVAGGVGATTIAVNLAVELSQRPDPPAICLIDLNLQFGNTGTYLDLAANSRVTDAYRQLATLDFDSFQSCLSRIGDHLRVFAAPTEILPLDGISEHDLRRIISLARDTADLVLLDLPHLVTDWSGTAWAESDIVFTLSRADVRSAQNMARLMALIRAERLAEGRLFHILNKVPAKPDAGWQASRGRFEAGIGTEFFHLLADGGEAVEAACNSGTTLARAAPSNPLRAGIMALATTLEPKIAHRRLQDARTA